MDAPKWSRGDQQKAQSILTALEQDFQSAFDSAKETSTTQAFTTQMEAFLNTISEQLSTTNLPVAAINGNLEVYRKTLPAVAEQYAANGFGKIYAQNFALDAHLSMLNLLVTNNKIEIAYDQFEIINLSSQLNPVVGQAFTLELALGARSSQAKYGIAVNGQKLKTDGNNRSQYVFTPKVKGEQRLEAVVNVNNPLTGETVRTKKTFTYTVVAK